MRFVRVAPGLALALLVAGCGVEESLAVAGVDQDCIRIVSAAERLACFDAKAGTPPTLPSMEKTAAAALPSEPEAIALVRRIEVERAKGENAFRLLREEDAMPDQTRIGLSAPALGAGQGQMKLLVSCLSNISRLQLVTDKPIARDRTEIRLFLDGRPLGATRLWQVLEDGRVLDAGRGLVAIDQLRQLTQAGSSLRLESDSGQIDGLQFDAGNLHQLIALQREACHW
jgi:type VI secretion system protein VasI